MSKKVISLFAGAGGLDLGFIKAGYDILWANDYDVDACNTYRKNIGDHIVHGDITKISSNVMPDGVDVVIGGFPCQGFSIANKKRGMQDSRNFLYLELLRVVKDKKPDFFVVENVKGLLTMENGKIIEMIANDFKEIGYDVKYKLLNAAEYGVPQTRQRVIMVGNNKGFDYEFPEITHNIPGKKYSKERQLTPTTKDVIGHLAKSRISYNPITVKGKKVYNHIARTNVSDKFFGRKYHVNQHDVCDYLRIQRNNSEWTTPKIDKHFGYKHTAGHWFRKDNNSGSIPNKDDWKELKKILKFDDKFDKQVMTYVEKDIRFEQSLRITNWDRPSDTITASGPEIHVNKMRRLSVRETAIIQTFPDDHIFTGAIGKMYRQVGNAVPVKLGTVIADSISKYYKKD